MLHDDSFFQSQFLDLQLLKEWLTVNKLVFIAVPKYLTTVKLCLTGVLFKNYVLLERSSLDEAKTSIKTMKKKK